MKVASGRGEQRGDNEGERHEAEFEIAAALLTVRPISAFSADRSGSGVALVVSGPIAGAALAYRRSQRPKRTGRTGFLASQSTPIDGDAGTH